MKVLDDISVELPAITSLIEDLHVKVLTTIKDQDKALFTKSLDSITKDDILKLCTNFERLHSAVEGLSSFVLEFLPILNGRF